MKVILATVSAVLFALPAVAQQQNCGPRDPVVADLAGTYGETRQSIGVGNNGAVVEVFGNTESGSWTILVTQPNGISCLVAAGMMFEVLAEALPGEAL